MTLRSAALLAALALAVAGCSTTEVQPGASPAAVQPSGSPAPATDTAAAAGELDTSGDEALPEEVAGMLADYGVGAEHGVRAAIMTMDRVDEQRPLAVQASVRTDEVVFTDGEEEVTVPIPGDLVYVSIAPYVDQTHPCHFHALGGCQGEMVGEEVHVRIVDHLGSVLVEETATTWTNGFVGYWLPRDAHGTVTITQGELTGVAAFETGDGDPTCVTTLQLRA